MPPGCRADLPCSRRSCILGARLFSGEATMVESRRNVLLAGVGLAAAPLAQALSPLPPLSSRKVLADEYWADKNGVKLWVYRKRIEGLAAGAPKLFCVHGSSYSGKTMFDLQVPDRS